MNKKWANLFLIVCYPLFTAGQLWNYISKQKKDDLFDRITLYTSDWIGSHILLLFGALMVIPAAYKIYIHTRFKAKIISLLGFICCILGILSLLGQFAIDFWLVQISHLGRDSTYAQLRSLQGHPVIQFLCYDMAAAWFLGSILAGIGLIVSKSISKYSIILYFVALALVVAEQVIHPLVSRLSYALISISYIWMFYNELKKSR